MNVARRRLLQSLAIAGSAKAQLTGDGLRGTAALHGSNLTDERLRVVEPVIERRLAQQLKALRGIEIDDAVEPHGRI